MRKIIVILGSLIYLLPGCVNRNAIFKVDFKRETCFGSEKSTLTVSREADSILTRLIINNQLIKETKLDYPFQSVIPAFVNDLKKTESKGMCTTVDTYVVYVDNQIIKKEITGCDWNGFAGLKRALLNIYE